MAFSRFGILRDGVESVHGVEGMLAGGLAGRLTCGLALFVARRFLLVSGVLLNFGFIDFPDVC